MSVVALSGCGTDWNIQTSWKKTMNQSQNIESYSTSLSNQNYQNILQKTDPVVVDIRSKQELMDTWVIPWVDKNIDYYKKDFDEKLSSLDKNKTYIIYCNSGNRSWKTLDLMEGLGFENVYHIENGIVWWLQDQKDTLMCNSNEFDFC